MAGNVDALYIFTDNTVVSALESVIQVAEENNLPLIVGEPDSVERGGLATRGLSYHELGRKTGEMALQIIDNNKKPQNMPVQYLQQSQLQLVLNQKAAENMNVEFPESIINNADEIVEE